MCCNCCSETQRKCWVYGFATILLAFGVATVVFWPNIADSLLRDNLKLKNGTNAFEGWVVAPIPIYFEVMLFNWTNPQDIRNPNVKPKFEEIGPFVYLEKHSKENLTFYDNHTVAYYQRRTWFFDPERSNGSLSDMITSVHVVSMTVADDARKRNKYVKKVINFVLNHEGGKLYATKPAGQWIFDGFQDDLIDFLNIFNSSKINVPYKRFAWLADRNDSLTADGRFTISTGTDDIYKLGRITNWDGETETSFFERPCNIINGSAGDIFPPNMNTQDEITIFAIDTCRYLNLRPMGTLELHGLTATKWVGTNETLDSGENYATQSCFCNPLKEECPKTGVVDCKKCRANAPIYASFPHFYLADESYLNAVEGLKPNKSIHEFSMAIEPLTGIPLDARGRVQINVMIEPDDDFDIYRGIPKVLMPIFWFTERAEMTAEVANRAKFGLNLGTYGIYVGIALIVVSATLFIGGIALTMTGSWFCNAANEYDDDDEDILSTAEYEPHRQDAIQIDIGNVNPVLEHEQQQQQQQPESASNTQPTT